MLLVLSVVLLPYEAIKLLPSAYRPISLIPIAFLFMFALGSIGKGAARSSQLKLLLFVLYALAASLVSYALSPYAELGDFLITLAAGFISFVGLSSALSKKACGTSVDEHVLWFAKLLGKAFYIPLAVGVMEAFSLAGVLPTSVNEFLIGIFGGNQSSRLCITTYEASWASMQMLYIAPVYAFLFYRTRRKTYAVAFATSILLLLFTNSMQGAICGILGLLFFPFLYSYSKGDLLQLAKKGLPVIVVAVVVAGLFLAFILAAPGSSYYRSRVLGFVGLDQLIQSDASSFIRICYPLFCLALLRFSPLIGTGGGSFPDYLSGLIERYTPWAASGAMPEVTRQLTGGQSISAMCFYTRIIGELGVIGFVIFAVFLKSVLVKLKTVSSLRGGALIVLWVSMTLCLLFQFQSFAYLPFWLMLALLSSLLLADQTELASAIDLSQKQVVLRRK